MSYSSLSHPFRSLIISRTGYDAAADWRGRPHPDNLLNQKHALAVQGAETAWKTLAHQMEQVSSNCRRTFDPHTCSQVLEVLFVGGLLLHRPRR